jgi:uncharacterized damage-inducible protein DinB
MRPFFDAILSELENLHAAVEKTLDGLPPEALDWAPAAGANSLGALAVHVAGSERYWIGEVSGQEPASRDREAEFQSRGLAAAALQRRLSDTLAHSRTVLARLSEADLALKRLTTPQGREYNTAGALLHSLAHTAEHKGHMEFTRQLWDQRRAS